MPLKNRFSASLVDGDSVLAPPLSCFVWTSYAPLVHQVSSNIKKFTSNGLLSEWNEPTERESELVFIIDDLESEIDDSKGFSVDKLLFSKKVNESISQNNVSDALSYSWVPAVLFEARYFKKETLPPVPEVICSTAMSVASVHISLSANNYGSASLSEYPLYVFVRYKSDVLDHRYGHWVPSSYVRLPSSSFISSLGSALQVCRLSYNFSSNRLESSLTTKDQYSQFDKQSLAPISSFLSFSSSDFVMENSNSTKRCYRIVNAFRGPYIYGSWTKEMKELSHEKASALFFDNRLQRDMQTPTSMRMIHYLNCYVFPPWYFSPYELLNAEFDLTNPHMVLYDGYLCPFTLMVYTSSYQLSQSLKRLKHHSQLQSDSLPLEFSESSSKIASSVSRNSQCCFRPPGIEIYRDDERGISIFEVDGSKHIDYCRRLALIGKSFLEHKLIAHDVMLYIFYVACLHHIHFPNIINDPTVVYFAGYFSWERGVSHCNLACISVLPCFQGMGIGQCLISISYELAYRRGHVGSPEKPLSDLGKESYLRFWARKIQQWMRSIVHNTCKELLDQNTLSLVRKKENDDTNRGMEELYLLADEMSMDSHYDLKSPIIKLSLSSILELLGKDNVEITTTVDNIAQEVRLDPVDVLTTLIHIGLLHRNADNATMLRLVIPVEFVLRSIPNNTHKKNTQSFFFQFQYLYSK